MSTTIDERVVEMRFDNRNFEKNVKTSMSTLDKLKQKLNLKGASDGLTELEKKASKVTFDPMSKSIDAVQAKFSYFQATIQHQLNRIVDSAVDAGKRVASAFTIEPVKTGFNEYELKMGSIQTIMSSTGEDLKTVNRYLEELNTYSDKTIYSFSDMTNNIGKFTNAGVKLEDAVAAIKGISNEAAVSGANAGEASRAMYNFAQALSAGYVKLIDWKSIEIANMATVEFKQQLIDTAVELGTLKKAGDKYVTTTTNAQGKTSDAFDALKNFNEALNNQWLTTDVLTKTLAKYADETTDIGKKAYAAAQDVKTFSMMMDTLKEAAQSGWAQTWELLVGDLEESKKLFTEGAEFFGGLIDKASKARNRLLGGALDNIISEKDWKKLDDAGKATQNFQDLLILVAKEHNIAVESMIKTEGSFADTLKNGWLTDEIYTEAISHMSDAEKELLEQEVANIKNTKERTKRYGELTKALEEVDRPYTELAEKMNRQSGRELLIDSIRNSLQAIVKTIHSIKEASNDVFHKITSDDIYNFINRLHDFSVHLTKIDEDGSKITRTFRGLFSVVRLIGNVINGTFKIGLKVVQSILGHFNLEILDVTASIGDALYNFDQWIKKNDIIGKGINKIVTIIAQFINYIKEIPLVQSSIQKINNKINNTFDSISNKLPKVKQRFDEFIERVKALDHVSLDNIDDIFKDFYDNVWSYLFDFKNVFNESKMSFENFKEKIVNGLADADSHFFNFKDNIIKYASALKEKIGDVDIFGSLLTIGSGVVVFKSANRIMKIFESLGGFAKAIKSPLESFAGVLNRLGKTLKAYSFNLKSKGILNVAIAISVLAGSLAVLSLCDSKKLIASAIALTIVSGGLTVLCAVLGKFSAVSIGKVSASMLSIAGALVVLVVALKKLESIKTEGLGARLGALAGLATGLLVFGALASLIPGVKRSAVSLLAFSVALRVLANALAKLNNLNLDNANGFVKVFKSILLSMAALAKLSNGMSAKTAIGMLGLVVSLRMFVNTFEKIISLDYVKIQTGMSSLISVFTMFSSLLIASKFAGKNSAKAGAMMLAMSISLLIMVKAIKKIGKLDAHDVKKGKNAISELTAVFGIVVALSKFAGKNAGKAGAMLLGMSGTFMAVAVAMTILGRLKDDQIKRAMKAITGISACFALLIASTGLSKFGEGTKSAILAMTVTIGAMTVALGALSFINPEKLKSSTIALSSVMAMFALMTASTKFINKKTASQIAIMAGVVGVIGTIIGAVSKLSPENAVNSATAISVLLGALSGSLVIINKVGKVKKENIKALYELSGVVAVLGTILGVMSALNVEASLTNVAGITILLTSLVGAIGVLNKVKEINAKSILAMYALSGVVAVLAVIMGVMQKLNVQPSIETALSLSTFLVAMSAVCLILSKVGGGAGAALSGALALDGVIAVIGTLVYAIGALFKNNLLDKSTMAEGFEILNMMAYGLGTFVGNILGGLIDGAMSGLPAIGAYLTQFTDNAKGFFDCLENLDPGIATSAKNLALALLAISGAEILDGIAGWLTGTSDTGEFGKKLKPFAEGLVDFSETVKGKIDKDSVETATNAGKMITALANDVPNSGGLLGAFLGENDVDIFGSKLKPFAEGLVDFSETVKGKIDKDSVETATNAGKMITELADSIPDSGGVLGSFLGENDVDIFGKKLKPFAEGLVDFSETVKGKIDENVVKSATLSGTMITELANSIPDSGGVLGDFLGDNDIQEFGSKLYSFAKGLVDFSNTVDGTIDANSVSMAVNAGKLITQLANTVPSSAGTLSEFFSGGTDIEKFGKKLKGFGDGLASFCNGELSKVSTSELVITVSKLQEIIKLMSTINAGSIESIKTFNSAFSSVAKISISKFVSDFEDNNLSAKNAINKFFSDSVSAILSYYVGFRNAGNNATTGFIEGLLIKVNSGDVYSAGKTIGDTALKAAKNSLDIHSPSRKMKKVGKFAIDGFIEGITTSGVKIGTVTKAVFSKFVVDALNSVKDTKIAQGIIKSYSNTYVNSSKKITKQQKTATKVIELYAQQLYKASDYYKDDKKTLQDHLSQLKEYYKKRSSLNNEFHKANEKLAKAKNKSDKASAQNQKKNIEKNIRENNKAIESTKKQIDKDQKQIVTNTNKVLNEVKTSIKNAVKDYVDIFNVASKDINLFSAIEETEKVLTLKDTIKNSLMDTLSLNNFGLDAGINMLEKFSSSAENLTESIKTANEELTDSKETLAKAEKELIEAQTKSFAVNGRSQKYLKEIAELEQKVAEAKERVAQAEENLNNLQKSPTTDILDNMKSNVDAYDKWMNDLKELSKTTISKELLTYLKGLGIAGSEQVSTFAKMTKEELQQANEYWKTYNSMSSTTLINGIKDKSAIMTEWGKSIKKFAKLNIDETVKTKLLQEFQEQGIDSAEYLNQILSMSKDELKEFVNSYKEMINVPNQVSKEIAKSMESVTKKTKENKSAMLEYIDTMSANLKAAQDYEKNLKKLKKNGISDGLYDQLVANADKTLIATFAKASEQEIKAANMIYAETAKTQADAWLDSYTSRLTDASTWNENMKKLAKLNIPKKMKETLYAEFNEKGIESNSLLEMILGFDENQLSKFTKTYEKTGKISNSIANDIIAGSASVSTEVQKQFNDSLSKSANEAMTAMKKEIDNHKPKVKKSFTSAGSEAVKEVKKHVNKTNGKSVSNNFCDGMIKGLEEKSPDLKSAAEKTAKDNVLNAVKNVLKIKSPSREMIKVGRFCDEGLAVGLSEYSYLTEDAAEEISEDALFNMQNVIDKIANWASSGIDSSPMIRPVLDMNELQRQIGLIDGMFNSETIGMNAEIASRINNRAMRQSQSQNGSMVNSNNSNCDNYSPTFENTFHITGDNPKEIANEVSKILQHQVQRRSTTWA